MMYRLVDTAAPASEPLALSDLKTFLRVDHDNDDGLLAALIAAARQACERVTGRILITRGCSLYLDRWPEGRRALALPVSPVQSVSAINVYAADNSSVTLAASDYAVDAAGARIALTEGALPPCPGRIINGIEIELTAGYGDDAADIPAPLVQGLRQLAAHLYENRGDANSADNALSASGAAALFAPYRVMTLA